jgi:hypothetical protein
MSKPSEKPEWASGMAAAITTPGGAKKALGWIVEKPPHQFFNWLSYWTYQWINYLEDTTDDLITDLAAETAARVAADSTEATTRASADTTEATNRATADTAILAKISGLFDAIVGSAGYCTHASIGAALAAFPTGKARIYVVENQALNATVSISVDDIELIFKPGVVISNAGAGTAITTVGANTKIVGGKFTGFTNGIEVGAAAARCKLRDIWFNSNTTDVLDNSDNATVIGCV